MIAAAHPGKMGDALYALPFLRYLYGVNGEKIDFYTSVYCQPLRRLFEYQPYIRTFNVVQEYKLERMDMGCQPAEVPIPNGYGSVYQLGFKRIPDCALHQFIAKEQGVTTGLGIRYDYPDRYPVTRHNPYVCIAPRGPSSYTNLLNDLVFELWSRNIATVAIGGPGENSLINGFVVDLCGWNMLDTLAALAHAKAFVGLMSSQLVLANGFDIPRIALGHQHADQRHSVYTQWNHYPVNPSVDELLRLIGSV